MQEIIHILQKHGNLLDRFQVKSVSIFGSMARGEARIDSNIDILVEFFPDACVGYFTFARLQQSLSDILGRRVDLVTPDGLHKGMKARILAEAVHAC